MFSRYAKKRPSIHGKPGLPPRVQLQSCYATTHVRRNTGRRTPPAQRRPHTLTELLYAAGAGAQSGEMLVDSQSNPSNSPSPDVAHVDWMNQERAR